MRYLVTGGLGCIGSQIARRLVEQGHRVHIIDHAPAKRNQWIRENLDGVGVERERLENCGSWLAEWMGNCVDRVIHAAASTGIPWSIDNADEDWRANVDATKVLLDALRKTPIPTVVLSSVKPYWVPPRASLGAGLDEHALLDADEPYAASKAAGSLLAQAYARSYGIPVVTLRCSNLYGPAPCHGPRHGWLTWFAISAAIGRPVVVEGSGNQARDMLHASDVHSACMAALDNAEQLKGEVFNIGGGRENIISVREAAELLNEYTGCEIRSGEGRRMDDDLVFVNHAKITNATGWIPRVSVRDGLREVLDWAANNRAALTEIYEGV